MYWRRWPFNRHCLYYPNPYMGIPGWCSTPYPVSPGRDYPGYGPQYPLMQYPGYGPQYPVGPAMQYPGYGSQYPGSAVGGAEEVMPPMPAGTPYNPVQSPYGSVAGAETPVASNAPLVPNSWPAAYPPMPFVPWTPPAPAVSNPACPHTGCDWPPNQMPAEITATPAQSPAAPSAEIMPAEPFQTEPAADYAETDYMPAGSEGVESLPSMSDPSTETVEVEAGEALPGDAESVDNEESREPVAPGAVLGTIEGIVSVKVGSRPARPLTNQLVLICNRATGERFQAYTDNQGYYSRRVPEGQYIVQIRQRIAAPFVRQRLARVQVLRRTVNDINVVCAESSPGNLTG